MENTGFVLQEPRTDRDQTIDRTIKETFKSLSLLADSLIEEAKKRTKTRGEYIAFMEGAAYIFYKVCQRDDVKSASRSGGITTIQDAINHCYDLIPFMEENELYEHIKLISWFNELLIFRGEQPIQMPTEYMTNERIKKCYEAFSTRHQKANLRISDNFVNMKGE